MRADVLCVDAQDRYVLLMRFWHPELTLVRRGRQRAKSACGGALSCSASANVSAARFSSSWLRAIRAENGRSVIPPASGAGAMNVSMLVCVRSDAGLAESEFIFRER